MSESQKSNKWLAIGGAIFVLVALGIAGVLIYQNYQSKEKEKTEVSSPTPTVDPIANWLIYTKENICYTFKYPKEVTLKERPEENIIHLSLWGQTQKE